MRKRITRHSKGDELDEKPAGMYAVVCSTTHEFGAGGDAIAIITENGRGMASSGTLAEALLAREVNCRDNWPSDFPREAGYGLPYVISPEPPLLALLSARSEVEATRANGHSFTWSSPETRQWDLFPSGRPRKRKYPKVRA